jgi:hypothetical protein
VPGGDQGLNAAGAAGFAHSRLESVGISFDYLSMLRA